mgnify:CR=1 FL=1|jgi:hypothetical protein
MVCYLLSKVYEEACNDPFGTVARILKWNPMVLELAAWNIGADGGNRTDLIAARLQPIETDLHILIELRANMNSMVLRGSLDRLGFVFQTPSDTSRIRIP